jgi:hypothetical protein
MRRKKILHSMLDPLDRYVMASSKKSGDTISAADASGGEVSHATVSDAEALDLLAEWLAANPVERRVIDAAHAPDGTITFKLQHEKGIASSYTQRTLSGAIRTALGIAKAAGAR